MFSRLCLAVDECHISFLTALLLYAVEARGDGDNKKGSNAIRRILARPFEPTLHSPHQYLPTYDYHIRPQEFCLLPAADHTDQPSDNALDFVHQLTRMHNKVPAEDALKHAWLL